MSSLTRPNLVIWSQAKFGFSPTHPTLDSLRFDSLTFEGVTAVLA